MNVSIPVVLQTQNLFSDFQFLIYSEWLKEKKSTDIQFLTFE